MSTPARRSGHLTASPWRCAATGLVALLIAVLGAAPAYAHATLLRTDPGQGARVDHAPGEVRLTFSEPVTPVPDAVRLIGTAQVVLRARTVDAVVVVSLPPLAPDARYAVAWRVVSTDGHPISGLLAFSVGDPPPAPAVPVPGPPVDRPLVAWALILMTGMWYAALLLVAGLLAFRVVCVRETRSADRLVPVLAVVGGVAALALMGLLPLSLAAEVPGDLASGWVAAGWRTPVAAALTCIGLGAVLFLRRRGRTVPALAAAAVALGSPVLTGHSASVTPAWLMIGGDLVHLAAAAVWSGGVLGLVLHLRAARRSDGPIRDAALTVRRFSTMAAGALVAVGLTGVVMAALILPDPGSLLTTAFGRVLLVKVALVAVAAVLGGWNRLRLIPVLEDSSAAAPHWRVLHRILRIEAGVLVTVMAVAGVLVHQNPEGAGGRQQPWTAELGSKTGPMAVRGRSERLVIIGTAAPTGGGTTQLTFTVADPSGEQIHPIEPPSVSAALPDKGIGPTRYESRESPTDPHGTYLVDLDTPLPGRWEVLIGVRLSTFAQETVRVDLDLG